ncbi:SusC/RagA family TonB-linked outer membrane protein [Pseudobacter ginsenosidimutans]|nr:SusC/RagA family TonB-linked outer membrane protein [Pseudobacter ginsenosidimutans]
MKLTAVLLVIIALLAGLRGEAQTVTLSVKNAKLENVLKGFKKQTGYSFFYNEDLLAKATRVTLELNNTQLADALSAIFSKQPALDYSINGPIVTIHEKIVVQNKSGQPNGNDQTTTLAVPGKSIKGTVFNKRYEALGNASVMIKGRNKGTSTATDGSFKLDDLNEEDVLIVSYIGYNTTEMPVKGRGTITFMLEETTNQLDEVVAQGYSKTTKRLSTSSVAKVSGEEIARQPIMNPILALQGKVPGMVLTPVVGYAASPVLIDIRGRGLLSDASSNPLIIIDGMPLPVGSNQGTAAGDGPVQGLMAALSPVQSQNFLFGLNPKDIESIEVLKDIGATAIYGSTGANGVILITTKRGKSVTSDLTVNVNYGISKITRYWDLLDTKQYLQMRREALYNDGLVPSKINAPDLVDWDTTRYTDWQREVWGRTAGALNATVSYSGGTPNFSHRISANYSRPDDITTVSGKNETIGFNLALDRRSNNQKFNTSLTVSYIHSFLNMISASNAASLPPNAPPIFDSAGNLNYGPWIGTGFETNFSSFESLLRPIESKSNVLNSSFRITYQVAKGLSLITMLGYSISNNDGITLTPIRSQNPTKNPTGSSSLSKSQTRSWNLEPQFSYDGSLFGKDRIGIIGGVTIRKTNAESMSVMATGYNNDAMLRSFALATNYYPYNTSRMYRYAGVMGRAEYVWDNKYVINGIWRRDGSSRFGPGRRFGNFWSAGIAWIASDEKWLRNALSPVVSFLKLNANIGTAGSDGGGDYQYLSQWSRDRMVNYDDVVPMKNLHAVNQYYQWALTRELNAGLQINFMGSGKLGLSVNYYRKRIGNQLLQNPTPIFTGFPDVFGNWNATVQNSGWEFSLNATFINKKNFRWNGSVNAGINRNRLLEYPDILKTPHFSKYLVGQPITNIYLLNYLGVDPMTGTYQFEDYNGDGNIDRASKLPPKTAPSDLQKELDMQPRVTGGISQSITYRKWSLFLSFDYKVQKGRNAYYNFSGPGQFGNMPLEIFNNHWREPGDNARFAKLSTLTSMASFARSQSTLGFSDASFLRFSNISISCQLPEPWLKKLGMKNGSFNINARNLFIITRYEGIDPEMQFFGGMPPAKTITAGFSITL